MTNTGCALVDDQDREFFHRELSSFVPDRVFDAHSHLWKVHRFAADTPNIPAELCSDVGYSETLNAFQQMLPGRRFAALFIPSVRDPAKFAESNGWTGEQTAADPQCRGEFRIMPHDDPEWVRDQVRRLGLHGLKCYHLHCSATPSWEANIPDYLPEPFVKVADEEGWVITLHMVKSRAVADPVNIRWIRHYCTTYPNMRLILAHSARGLQPSHNFEGLPQLTGLDNLYCDCSANCEPLAHESVIRILGHEKLLYGSDFFVSHMRGRSLGVADSFLWLYDDTPVWEVRGTTIRPVIVGLECLRSLKWACWSARLTDTQIEDIFWNNAARLFGFR